MNTRHIVLIQCPWLTALHPPNLGLAYVAAVLMEAGYKVTILDANIEMFHQLDTHDKELLQHSNRGLIIELGKNTLHKYPALINDLYRQIIELEPDVVGFSVWESNDFISLGIAKQLKNANKSLPIIFGGPSCYPLYSGRNYIQEECVDLVIYGEAEKTIVRVLNSFFSHNKLIPLSGGMLIRESGIVQDLGAGDRVEKLDELPYPAVNIFPMEKYINQEIPISFNRGCIFRCEYCEISEMRPGFRSREPKNILREIQYRLKEYPEKRNFFICDSTATANFKQLNELCELIIASDLEISFTGYATPHAYMNSEFLSKMRRAGFNNFVFGVESGSDRILERFGKKLKIGLIEKVVRETHNAGIKTGVNILVGLPGETDEDFFCSLEFLHRNREYINDIGISYFDIMPFSYIAFHPEQFNFTPEEIKLERMKLLRDAIDNLGLSYTVRDIPADKNNKSYFTVQEEIHCD